MSIDFETKEEEQKRLRAYLYQTDEQRQNDLKRWKKQRAIVKAEKIAAKKRAEKIRNRTVGAI